MGSVRLSQGKPTDSRGLAIGRPTVQVERHEYRMAPMNGHVDLIGAGPGDPKLLTLRGAELLGRADVVLYDGLSNRQLLEHAPNAAHICVGKHGLTRIWRQQEIIAEMLRHAGAGRRVARLKGGDPAIFARTAEEVEALNAAGISFEIVPGITAALAAGSYAGIPITHRGLASAVALVTGHEEPGKPASALDWDALARFPGTLVIYMGVTTAETWTAELLKAGKAGETPAAIVRRCSYPDQQVVHCRLDQVAQQLTPAGKMRPPVIVILGAVTSLAETMNWFEQRPLFGQCVLITSPVEEAESLAQPLRELGATVLLQPLVETRPSKDWAEVDHAIASLDQFEWLLFCSRDGVKRFLARLLETGRDARALAGCKLLALEHATKETLREFSLQADMVAEGIRAETLASQLAGAGGKRIALVSPGERGDLLANSLIDAGAEVTVVAAYSLQAVPTVSAEIRKLADAGKIDWVTVTSSTVAENLCRLFGGVLGQSRIASLSPVASQTLRDCGYEVTAEADPGTVEALIAAVVIEQESRGNP